MALRLIKKYSGLNLLASSPDGLWFLIRDAGNECLYNTQSQETIFLPNLLAKHTRKGFRFSATGQHLLAIESTDLGKKPVIVAWEVAQNAPEIMRLPQKSLDFEKIKLSPKMQYFALEAGKSAGKIKVALYGFPDGQLKQELNGQGKRIGYLKELFWHDDEYLTIFDAYGHLQKLRLADDVVVASLNFTNYVFRLIVSPDGEKVACFSTDDLPQEPNPSAKKHMELYDLSSKTKLLMEEMTKDNFARSMDFSYDSKLLAVRFVKSIAIYDVDSGKMLDYIDYKEGFGEVAFLTSGNLLIKDKEPELCSL